MFSIQVSTFEQRSIENETPSKLDYLKDPFTEISIYEILEFQEKLFFFRQFKIKNHKKKHQLASTSSFLKIFDQVFFDTN